MSRTCARAFCWPLLVTAIAAAQEEPRKPGPDPAGQALINPIAFGDASARVGKRVYARFCVTCHGLDGKSDTDMKDRLPARPADLTDGDWAYGGSDGEIFTLIRQGTSTGMEAYADKFDDQRTWHLVNYLRSLAPKSEVVLEEEELPENPFEATTDSVVRGRFTYDNHCAICHAEDGTGDTDYVEFLAVPPADFTMGKYRYGSKDGQIFNVIRDGTETGMEAFKDKVKDDELWHVVNYIKRFSR